MNEPDKLSSTKVNWRHGALALSVAGPLALLFAQPPLNQIQEYYNFADQRAFFGIPNFFDVTTNLAFLFVGLAGLWGCLKNRWEGMRPAWIALFVGLISVSAGSGYFHWNPGDDTLVWDRVSLTIGFVGLFVAIVGEHVSLKWGRLVLAPALVLGTVSVFYWHRFDDLRLYYWVQFMPLLAIPTVLVLFRSRYSHQGFLAATLVCYVLAKLTEIYDREIYNFTGRVFSGHSMKHLLAALGCLAVVMMLKRRKLLGI